MKAAHSCDDDDSAFVSETKSNTISSIIASRLKDEVPTLILQTIGQNNSLLLEDDVTSTVEGSADNDERRTMHIVIHNADHLPLSDSLTLTSTSIDSITCPPSTPLGPVTPLPPPTPATPQGRSRGFRYQWDASAFDPVIPVRCKTANGELHRSKFGSGSRGSCIKMSNMWYTPSEFEAACGKSSCKDWKRSIHYGGRTLQCLIEDGILIPHATCCMCAACCDDPSVTGPVRWFIPYKRKRRDYSEEVISVRSSSSSSGSLGSSREGSVSQCTGTQQFVLSGVSPESKDILQFLTSDQLSAVNIDQLLSVSGASNLTSNTRTVSPAAASLMVNGTSGSVSGTINGTSNLVGSHVNTMTSCDESQEQDTWNKLEEMCNSVLEQAQTLKQLITAARQESVLARETAVRQLRQQLEAEKKDALQALQIEAQMALVRAQAEAKRLKDIAVQEAIAQVRADMIQRSIGVSDISTSSLQSLVDRGSISLWSVAADNDRVFDSTVIVTAANDSET